MNVVFAGYGSLAPDPSSRFKGRLVDDVDRVIHDDFVVGVSWLNVSRYHVFPVCRWHLLAVADCLHLLDRTLDDFLGDPDLLGREDSPGARLAAVLVDLSVCANFSPEPWFGLLERVPALIKLAAEFCMVVLACSGAPGHAELRTLLTTPARRHALRSHRAILLSAFDDTYLREYVDRELLSMPES